MTQVRKESKQVRKGLIVWPNHNDSEAEPGDILLKRQIAITTYEYIELTRCQSQEGTVLLTLPRTVPDGLYMIGWPKLEPKTNIQVFVKQHADHEF